MSVDQSTLGLSHSLIKWIFMDFYGPIIILIDWLYGVKYRFQQYVSYMEAASAAIHAFLEFLLPVPYTVFFPTTSRVRQRRLCLPKYEYMKLVDRDWNDEATIRFRHGRVCRATYEYMKLVDWDWNDQATGRFRHGQVCCAKCEYLYENNTLEWPSHWQISTSTSLPCEERVHETSKLEWPSNWQISTRMSLHCEVRVHENNRLEWQSH